MRRFTFQHTIILFALIIGLLIGAFLITHRDHPENQTAKQAEVGQSNPLTITISDGFDYPFSSDSYPKQTRDKVGWYNAQDFGVNDHLGEDWNTKTGGNTDCGLPVYAASKGMIIFAGEAGPGWGKVIIVRHRLRDGALIETLYGHLQSFARTSGEVDRREVIGRIGNGSGAYLCHLHFELRQSNCLSWGQVGPGYSRDRTGWTDPSNFIDANRPFKQRPVESSSNR